MELSAGLGLKPVFFGEALARREEGLWFEVHAENYMVAGGPRRGWLQAIRSRFPVSLHGVGLSLAADAQPDARHLERLAALVERIEPALVSEHLAWATREGAYLPDLLPFPRTRTALARIAANVGRVQDRLGRRIAIENPSHYLRIEGHEYDEIGFLDEIARRTGCDLLLDVNNVFVAANNLGFDAGSWIDAFPGKDVCEIHLAGHAPDPRLGDALLIDTHDAPVAAPVWSLYRRLVARIGPRPTLIERDARLPAFEELMAERATAHEVLALACPEAEEPGAARPLVVPGSREAGDAREAREVREVREVRTALDAGDARRAGELDRFEGAFARALLEPVDGAPCDEELRAVVAQPGFAVYRNTVMRGLVDALRANYPGVARILGDELFDGLAGCFARYTPPMQPCLAEYGEGFADFLEAVAPKARLPYLADVARLDRLWTEAHLASDEPPLDAATVGKLAVEDPMRLALVPHASARWAWFDRHPALTIWRSSREAAASSRAVPASTRTVPTSSDAAPASTRGAPALRAEGALIARPRDGVRSTSLDRAGCAFLDACAEGRPIGQCAQAAFDMDPRVDLAALLGGLVCSGAFTRIERLP